MQNDKLALRILNLLQAPQQGNQQVLEHQPIFVHFYIIQESFIYLRIRDELCSSKQIAFKNRRTCISDAFYTHKGLPFTS